ncbi:abscisic acid 8'-hydroxylase 4-like [Hordeum vulgare]|nr:abscisic acid 8'-hydroxylase 4-like [Hordeum vulgare]
MAGGLVDNGATGVAGLTYVFLLSTPAGAAIACLLAADPQHFAKRYVCTVADLLGEHSLLRTWHRAHRRTRHSFTGLFAFVPTTAFATGSNFHATRSTTPPPDPALLPPDASKNRRFFCHRALEMKREAREGEGGEE